MNTSAAATAAAISCLFLHFLGKQQFRKTIYILDIFNLMRILSTRALIAFFRLLHIVLIHASPVCPPPHILLLSTMGYVPFAFCYT